MSASRFDNFAPWSELQHAYGTAEDMPALLDKVLTLRDGKLHKELGELWSRVLHQGTIYSASGPSVGAIVSELPRLRVQEKALFYELLTGFADSARLAMEQGPQDGGCAGGDPGDGRAIAEELSKAHPLFLVDIQAEDVTVRRCAIYLLTAFEADNRSLATQLQELYFQERESVVREAIVTGLRRVSQSNDDWRSFLGRALSYETAGDNRFDLLYLTLKQHQGDEELLAQFVNSFVEQNTDASHHFCSGADRFFEILGLLRKQERLQLMSDTLRRSSADGFARVLAEHLLRDAFDDQRTGWDSVATSLHREGDAKPARYPLLGMIVRSVGTLLWLKMAPRFFRRRMRSATQRKGTYQVEYLSVKGYPPSIPKSLTREQSDALLLIAAKPELWSFRTNLWTLFGLPDTATGIAEFVERTASKTPGEEAKQSD